MIRLGLNWPRMRAVAVLTPLILLGVVLWVFLAREQPERVRKETVEAPRAESAQEERGDSKLPMRIGGVVLSGGEPFEGARVEVWNDARHASLAECVSDARGRFAVEVPAGKVVVVALGSQCAPAVQRVELSTDRVRLELVGGVVARGELVNEAGEPIVGAHIEDTRQGVQERMGVVGDRLVLGDRDVRRQRAQNSPERRRGGEHDPGARPRRDRIAREIDDVPEAPVASDQHGAVGNGLTAPARTREGYWNR